MTTAAAAVPAPEVPPTATAAPPAVPPAVPAAPAAAATPAPVATPPAAATPPPATPPAAEPVSKDGTPPAAPKAPAKYALVVSAKGQAHVSARDLQRLEDIARAADWSNEDAQQALDEHLAIIEAQAAEFRAALVADRDYGGDKLADTDRLARLAIDRIRPVGHPRRDAFLATLNRGGAVDNIEIASALADLGRQMAEDRPVGGSGGGGSIPRDPAEVLYGKPADPPTP